MKITVINGTEVKGCTYNIKENFLSDLQDENEIVEFYLPKDLPYFCTGCKKCFFRSEQLCPHAEYVTPIWNSMLNSDLIIFASPVYALRVTAQIKSLLDHLCVHWMVHRPDEKMFDKRAVILTNAVGIFNKGAQKDIETSLSWLGISHIKKCGVGLLEGVIWRELSDKRKENILKKVKKLSRKYTKSSTTKMGIKVKMKFMITKMMHQSAAQKEEILSADNKYWLDKGWIKY